MQPLAAQSPSPARAPGTEAGNAERAVNLVRTFPGLPEVAPDLASQPPLVARSPSPEMQAPPAPPLAARSPSPATRPPPAPPASPERPSMGGVSVVASGHAMPAAGPPLPSQGEVNRRAKIAAHYARSKADLINARSKAKRAVAEATCKGMLGTELGSVAQQPPQAPTATNEDAGRACTQGGDDGDGGEDVFYCLYQQARKHADALPQQQPRKRGRRLAARSPSPERAPGTEAGNAERAVNLVRTFPGLPEVAAVLASHQPPAPPPVVCLRIIKWPEDRSWNAFQTAHRGGGRKNMGDFINARAALEPLLPSQVAAELEAKRDKRRVVQKECAKRKRALIGEVNWKAYEKVKTAKKYANQKARAVDEAKRKAMLQTELESVAKQQLSPAPSFLQEPLPGVKQPPLQHPSFQSPPSLQAQSFLQDPLPGIKQPPLPQPSFQPPPELASAATE